MCQRGFIKYNEEREGIRKETETETETLIAFK